jgi:hypothetical protein
MGIAILYTSGWLHEIVLDLASPGAASLTSGAGAENLFDHIFTRPS